MPMIKRPLILSIIYIFLSCATEYNRKDIIKNSERYLTESKFERAYTEFQSGVEYHFGDIELHREFIRFISKVHRCEDARRFYENKKKKYEHIYYYAMGLLGVVCTDGKRDEVMRNFERAIQYSPDNYEIRLRYGSILTEYELYDEAFKQFEALYKNGQKTPSLLSYMALVSVHLGRFDNGRGYVREMMDMDFSEADLTRARAAIDIINASCLSVPEEIGDSFKKVLDMILVEDRPVQARETVESLLLKYPDIPSLHLVKSMALSLTGEFSSGLYELTLAGDVYSGCAYFQYTGGIIYLGVQKDEKGIGMLERAIELNPLMVNAYRILSELYISKRENTKAIKCLNYYLKLNRGDYKNRFIYGRLLLQERRFEDALRQFESILNADPENSLGMVGMGIWHAEMARNSKERSQRENHLKKSIEYLNDAIKRDPENETIKSIIRSLNVKED